jgi:putative transposase
MGSTQLAIVRAVITGLLISFDRRHWRAGNLIRVRLRQAWDNVFVERLLRSVKYEAIYIRDYYRVSDLESGLAAYFGFYDKERPDQCLGSRTPAEVELAGIQAG